jgi:DNA-binding NarL/FixJ family response regulator
VFGREPERARIEQLLDRASVGPVGIAVEGTAGIGKTTVCRHAVDAARRRGYLVLEAAPSEADAALAFSGLGDLFDGLADDTLAGLPDPQRRALGAALFLNDASDAPTEVEALPRAVLGVLRRLAVEAAVVVAIDDEQWLDRPSGRVLAFALRRIRDERICMLLSRRTDGDGPLWPALRDGFTAGIDVVGLAGVDLPTTRRLLSGVLDSKISRRIVERVHEVSGGNPLYVLALGEEIKRANVGADGWRELPIPSTLADAIAERLEQAGPGVEAPLFAVAALSDPTVRLLGAALEGFDVRDLDEAVRAGVIEINGERISFTHPLLASVHYAGVPVSERHELHLRLAAAVSDPVERALHLAAGTERPDERVAAELEAAAGLAVRRGAPEAAAELLEHAIRLTPADYRSARWARTTAAAEQHYAAGGFERVRQLLEELLLERPDGPTSVRARVWLALVRRDDFEFAGWMLAQALVDAGDDDRLIFEVERVRSEWTANLGDYAGQVEHAEAAVASAERLGEPGPLASALAQLGAGLWNRGQGLSRDLFERAVELERAADESAPTYFMASTVYGAQLRHENDLDAARPLLERAVERARRRGEESGDLTPLLVRLAYLESDAGNRAAADRWLAEATEAAGQQMNEEMDSWLADVQGDIAANQGRLEQARVCAEQVRALANRNRDVQMQRDGDVLLANIELLGGDPDAAHRRLKPWRDRTIANGPWYIGWRLLSLWSSDIEALIALDRLDEAQQVADDLLDRALPYPNPHGVAIAKRCEGLVLAAHGELAGAVEAMDAALAHHAQRPLPLEIGRTLLEKGSIERRAKRKTAAKQTLEQALAVLEPLDAAIWVARARDELGRIGLRGTAQAEGLTPAQSRVAELAAGGATNREIAHTLYMSERTVEAHLTKIYRELGIRSRAQLASALAATASAESSGTTPIETPLA